MRRSLMMVIVMALFVSACSNDAPAGTVEVTEGADTLGCSDGTYELAIDSVTEDVTKVITCTEGDTGTFTIVFDPDGYDTGIGEQNGPWRIVDATADFTGLQGEGDYWLLSDVETYTGVIMTPTEPQRITLHTHPTETAQS